MDMIERVRADNPGPMTLTGTNTWLLPGVSGVVVVDPGPALPSHLAAIDQYGPVELVVLTHRHLDHSESAGTFDVPVRAVDPDFGEPMAEGSTLPGGLVVLSTPGHTDDSVCLWHAASGALLTGDTLLGSGSSVIAHGEGCVSDSLESLARLVSFCRTAQVARLLPGHGEPVVGDVTARVEHDLRHRQQRLAQVTAAVEAGAGSVVEVAGTVHPGVEAGLQAAAQSSVAAHLDHLGLLDPDDPWLVSPRRRGENQA